MFIIDTIRGKVLGFLRKKTEEEMLMIPCAWCGRTRIIQQIGPTNDLLQGVITCGYCEGKTMFGMRAGIIEFLPGKLYQAELDRLVSNHVRVGFEEAVLSLYGGAFRGCVALCRSCIEDALGEKEIRGKDLYEKIDDAKAQKVLGDEEIARAHAARLIGRDALHRGRTVTETEALTALRNTIDLLNHISRQKPATPPVKGSSAT